MVKVTYTNFITESRNRIVALIDDRTKVPDPVSTNTGVEVRKFVHSRDPGSKKYSSQ